MAMRIREAFRRWRRLSTADHLATVEMAGLVASVTVAMHLLGFNRTRRLLKLLQPPAAPIAAGTPHLVQRYVNALARVSHRAAWAGRCLSRSLALAHALSRRGIPAAVHIGVREVAPFAAHAWVVSNGVALGERRNMPQSHHATFMLG